MESADMVEKPELLCHHAEGTRQCLNDIVHARHIRKHVCHGLGLCMSDLR